MNYCSRSLRRSRYGRQRAADTDDLAHTRPVTISARSVMIPRRSTPTISSILGGAPGCLHETTHRRHSRVACVSDGFTDECTRAISTHPQGVSVGRLRRLGTGIMATPPSWLVSRSRLPPQNRRRPVAPTAHRPSTRRAWAVPRPTGRAFRQSRSTAALSPSRPGDAEFGWGLHGWADLR
jgi:hypothetical protein